MQLPLSFPSGSPAVKNLQCQTQADYTDSRGNRQGQRLSSKQGQHFEVFFARLPHHVIGKRRGGRSLVPRQGEQVVPDELLVEALLGNADGIALSGPEPGGVRGDRKSTRLNSSHQLISYAVFCLKKKKK